MLLTISKTVALPVPAAGVWAFLRQPARVAGCLPNVRDFREDGAPNRYSTLLVERLGPFQVQIPLTLEVSEDEAGQEVLAIVSGEDRAGQARVRGQVRATVRAAETGGSILDIASEVEVLGRMAALGAVPIRRRGDQVFEQFVGNIRAQLERQDD